MAVKVGDVCYFIVHAYFHYIGEVTEILGVRRVALRNVVQVHSHNSNWTNFFKHGFSKETKFDEIGETPDLGYIVAHRWPHPVPRKEQS